MADLKAQLEITADASGVEVGTNKAKRSLKDLGAAAAYAGKEASTGLGEIGGGGAKAAQKVDAATRNMIGSIQRTTAAMDAGGRSSSKYYELLAAQRGVNAEALKPYLAQLDAVNAKQAAANATLASAAPVMRRTGLSAKEMAFALRGVPAQFTDIATSLQGGQKPLTVFLQQGGQLKDMFGGIAPAARALGGYVLSLITPFTLAASAAGLLAYAYSQGSKEADAYAKSLILTGNAAGMTVGELQLMAERVRTVGSTHSEAAAALAEFAGSSNISGQSLEKFAAVAIRVQRETGQAVSETVKQFSELGKDPVAASIKLNETTRFLTAEIYNQIKALEDQGRTSEAALKAQDAYADVMNRRMDQLAGRLGTIEKAWRDVAFGAKLAWDAMLDIGRPDTSSEAIDKAFVARESLEKQLQSAEKWGDKERAKYLQNQLEANKKIINGLRARGDAERQQAQKSKKDAEQASNAIGLSKYLDDSKYADNKTRRSLDLKKENAEFSAAVKGFAVGSVEYETAFARHQNNIAKIKEQYRDKAGAKAALQIEKAQLGMDVANIQKAGEQLISSYSNAEKVMESLRSAGLIGDKEYYESKRAFIRLETDAKEEALQQEISRHQQEKLTGKDRIDNDKKIADAQAKIAILRGDASAKLEVLSNQESTAVKRLQLSYLAASQAAQDYFDSIQRQQTRDLSAIGQGAQRRRFDSGLNQIEDRYAGQRRDLENQRAQLELEGKFTDEARAQYETRLGIITDFQAKAIASYSDYYANLIDKQGNWQLGMSEALQNYYDESRDIYKQTADLFANAMQGMEDSLTKFVKTGKLDFKSLADSIISDLIRIQIKSMISSASGGGGGLSALLGAVFGGFGGGIGMSTNSVGSLGSLGLSGGRASGGPVSAGAAYLVGEKGPEILRMGSQSGHVIPNHEIGGGGAMKVTIINNTTGRIDRVEERQISPTERALIISEAVQATSAQFSDPNSKMSKTFGRNYSSQRVR